MRSFLLLLTLLSQPLYADIFAFKDLEGYEKCLQADHLIDDTATGTGAQRRFLGPAEIQNRCVESAAKLLTGKKDKALMMTFIKMTKRGTAPENAIALIGALVSLDRKQCNEMEIYEVINKALSHPKEESSASNFQKARKVAKTCLKDSDYKKDFTDEKDSSNSYLSSNACEILLEEKLVPSCKKG